MIELFSKIHDIMNQIKGMTVGYSGLDKKMVFEYNGKLFVMECRELDPIEPYNPKTIREAMRKVRYL